MKKILPVLFLIFWSSSKAQVGDIQNSSSKDSIANAVANDIENPIPVLVHYFTGNKENSTHTLTWKASCTTAGADFFIERSIDGLRFNSINSIEASFERCLLPFTYIDQNPLSGINYYRIKMVSENERVIYSKVFSLGNIIKDFGISFSSAVVSRNNSAYLTIESNKNRKLMYFVSDFAGHIIQRGNTQVSVGNNLIELSTKMVISGIYNISIYTEQGEKKTLRFVKQ